MQWLLSYKKVVLCLQLFNKLLPKQSLLNICKLQRNKVKFSEKLKEKLDYHKGRDN